MREGFIPDIFTDFKSVLIRIAKRSPLKLHCNETSTFSFSLEETTITNNPHLIVRVWGASGAKLGTVTLHYTTHRIQVQGDPSTVTNCAEVFIAPLMKLTPVVHMLDRTKTNCFECIFAALNSLMSDLNLSTEFLITCSPCSDTEIDKDDRPIEDNYATPHQSPTLHRNPQPEKKSQSVISLSTPRKGFVSRINSILRSPASPTDSNLAARTNLLEKEVTSLKSEVQGLKTQLQVQKSTFEAKLEAVEVKLKTHLQEQENSLR